MGFNHQQTGIRASLVGCALSFALAASSQTLNDPCFTSPTVGTTFASTTNISNNNADCIRWTGTAWTGAWPGASVTLAPPGSVVNTRAIWMGDGTVWTTGGEGFGMRLSSGIVSGTTYSWNWTRVSHGTGSAGSFAPRIYTNTTGTMGYLIGNIPAASSAWFTGPISFTAVAAQAGHTYVYFHTNTPNGSGMFLACEATVLPMRLWGLKAWPADGKVQVEWMSADEDAFSTHVLERSPDGTSFDAVVSMPTHQGAGDHRYQHIDTESPSAGSVYYRVRTLTTDGQSVFSPVVELAHAVQWMEVKGPYPSPAIAGQAVTLEVFSPIAQTVKLQVRDVQGRLLHQSQEQLQEGNTNLTVQERFPAGLHYLTLTAAGWSQTLPISVVE